MQMQLDGLALSASGGRAVFRLSFLLMTLASLDACSDRSTEAATLVRSPVCEAAEFKKAEPFVGRWQGNWGDDSYWPTQLVIEDLRENCTVQVTFLVRGKGTPPFRKSISDGSLQFGLKPDSYAFTPGKNGVLEGYHSGNEYAQYITVTRQ